MKNGKMKIAPASVIRASDSCPAILKRIRKTSEFFRKLSLKALKNWHQNRGAKRLVVNRLADINGSESLVRKVYGGRPLEPKHFPLICRPYIRAQAGWFPTHSGGMWRIANHEAWFILRPAQWRPSGRPARRKMRGGQGANGLDTGGRGGRGQGAWRDGCRGRRRGHRALLGRRCRLCHPQCVHPCL